MKLTCIHPAEKSELESFINKLQDGALNSFPVTVIGFCGRFTTSSTTLGLLIDNLIDTDVFEEAFRDGNVTVPSIFALYQPLDRTIYLCLATPIIQSTAMQEKHIEALFILLHSCHAIYLVDDVPRMVSDECVLLKPIFLVSFASLLTFLYQSCMLATTY
jgi:hypothetical protein